MTVSCFSVTDVQRDGHSTKFNSYIPDSQSKHLSRLSTYSKSEELGLYKQKSAESDSDSLSLESLSLHSGSLSNTSSRNASPKPLRPSLKTPGMLQKLEPSKYASSRLHNLRPVVKKVKKKAIRQIESKLSTETLWTVQELISEHAKDKVLSVGDVNKLEAELKALLAIMLSNDSEITAAEELIGLKLHDLINKSFEMDEHEEAAVDSDSDKETDSKVAPEKNLFNDDAKSDPVKPMEFECKGAEVETKGTAEMIAKTEAENSEQVDISDSTGVKVISESNTDDVLEVDVELKGEYEIKRDTNFKSWSSSSGKNTKTVDEASEISCENEQIREVVKTSSKNGTEVLTEEFEKEYWGNTEGSKSVSTVWEDNAVYTEEWDESNIHTETGKNRNMSNSGLVTNALKGMEAEVDNKAVEHKIETASWDDMDRKPQRKKKTKGVLNTISSSGSSINSSSQAVIATNGVGDVSGIEEQDADNEIVEDMIEDNAEDVYYEASESCNGDDENSVNNPKSIQDVKTESDKELESAKHDKEEIKSGFNTDLRNSRDQFEEDDIEFESPPEFNRSLRMLKESYNDSFNADDIDTVDDVCNGREGSVSDEESVKIGENKGENVDGNQKSSRNKKLSKRKAARASMNVPFLKREDKEKLKTTIWSSLPRIATGDSSTVNSLVDSKQGSMDYNMHSKQTYTCAEDFKIVDQLKSGGFVNSSVKYLTGKMWKMVRSDSEATTLSNISDYITEFQTKDISTSTDDLPQISRQSELEFLNSCFPEVALEELECVLENCHNNTEWAVNLLVDWHYNVHFTEEEKSRFTTGMRKIQRPVSPVVPKLSNMESTSRPGTLLDLCFEKIEKEEIATRYFLTFNLKYLQQKS